MKILQEIKKVLMGGNGYFVIGHHVKKRLLDRGYVKGDIIGVIYNGNVVEVQYDQTFKTLKYVIAGSDLDGHPMVIVVARLPQHVFKVVTVMPPLDKNRFDRCI
ncbi:DUF4258 domain-containing protein [Priestia koreensis]|uniref:DUF4258 domain-containing protein n=1 Tax=Priestia koreensis TaxID=284581 RepID=A0A0M0LAT9_9BACI|nr:DUF4258 domain-containing protein [Priestia koreensis]KOO48171.1 hypothetical protein AMD01_05030 [Priestia koreensis]